MSTNKTTHQQTNNQTKHCPTTVHANNPKHTHQTNPQLNPKQPKPTHNPKHQPNQPTKSTTKLKTRKRQPRQLFTQPTNLWGEVYYFFAPDLSLVEFN